MMEVILTRNVDNVGIKNEVVKVKDGFARNYLFPRKLAIPATPGAKKSLARQIAQAAELRAKRMSEARMLAERLNKMYFKIFKKAGKEGKLYGSVTSAEIAELLKEVAGVELDKRKILLASPIKNLGLHSVNLKLEQGVVAEIQIEVLPVAEEDPSASEAAAKEAMGADGEASESGDAGSGEGGEGAEQA